MSKLKMVPFSSVLKDNTSKFTKIKKQDYLEKGTYKIIDQGQSFVAGFTNDSNCVNNFDDEVIIFGDHTRIFKFINFPIAIGADGVKVLGVLNKDEYDIKFLYYYLKSVKLHDAGYSRHFKFLKEIKIPFLQLHDQRKIAMLLSQIEELINKRADSIKLLDELIKSSFLNIFGDPYFNKLSFDQKGFLDIFDITTGKLDSNASEINGIYPFFTCAKETFKINSFAFNQEALLLAGNNAVGDYSIKYYSGKFNAYQRTYVLTLKDTQNSSYVFNKILLELKLLELQKKSIGANTKYLTLKILEKIQLIKPPKPLQDKFAEIVTQIEQTKTIYQNSLTELNNLFGSIAQKAFKGELDVSKMELIQKATQIVESQEEIIEKQVNYIDIENNPIFTKDFVKMLINQAGQLTNEKLMDTIKQYSFNEKVSFDDIRKTVIELLENKDIEQIVITTENASGFDKEIGFKIKK
ncbi:MAG: restriction endonuclease subunit S [Sulfurimonas sp.]|nr:restriction endonuclease subunit S [Sulfurimonas sp.]MDD5201669.1 restriction endonuclease subunit S [Sulfurimonas sp.]